MTNPNDVAASGKRAAMNRPKRRPRKPTQGLIDAAPVQAHLYEGLENVSHLTIGEKRVGDEPSGQLALIAYVTRKHDVDPNQMLPSEVKVRLPSGKIRSLPVDVIELPSHPRALGMRSGHIIRAGDGELGICGLTFIRDGSQYAATNAHVVANMKTQRFYGEPAVFDPGRSQYRPIGRTVYISAFPADTPTIEDLAIIRVDHVQVEALGLVGEMAPISGFASFLDLSAAEFWYNINGSRISLDAPQRAVGTGIGLLVDGELFRYTDFWALRVTQGIIAPGHSGSLVCTGTGKNIRACGMLFGGAPPTYAYVFPIESVWDRILNRLNRLN